MLTKTREKYLTLPAGWIPSAADWGYSTGRPMHKRENWKVHFTV